MSVRLTALTQLCGDYGLVVEGESFEAEDDVAESLESRGLAERYHPLPPLPPAFLAKMMAAPENKMVQPIENKAAEVPPAPRRKRR